MHLNEYYYVVIDSKSNFIIYIGDNKYKFEKGVKFLPKFTLYHEIWIEISNEIKIYIEPFIYNRVKVQKIPYNYKYNPSNELLSLLNNFPCIFTNLYIIDGNYDDNFITFYSEMGGNVF